MKLSFLTAVIVAASLMLPSCYKPKVAVADVSTFRHYVFGLSPLLTEAQREEVWNSLGNLVLEDASPGDEVVVSDAFALKELARFSIPNETLMVHNPSARARRLAPAFAALKAFLSAKVPEKTVPGTELILEPQFLREVSCNNPARPLSVVLVGSPLYDNPRDKAWSFAGARYPSDGHLLAEPLTSPFSIRGREAALEGVKVAHAYFTNEAFDSEAYRTAALRFWSIWVEGQKGELTSFTPDLKAAVRSVMKTNAGQVVTAKVCPEDDKVQMHLIHATPADPSETAWLMATRAEIEASSVPGKRVPSPLVQKLKVGIRWTANVDFDLYVRPRHDRPELYYGQSKTAEGSHMKDFVSAPPGVQGFESVNFDMPVDVRETTVAINLYRGELKGDTEVEVRVQADEKATAKVVKFKAGSGSRGKAVDGQRSKDPAWVLVDLAAILGVDRGQMARQGK